MSTLKAAERGVIMVTVWVGGLRGRLAMPSVSSVFDQKLFTLSPIYFSTVM